MVAIQVKIDDRSIREGQRILRAIPRAWPRVARRAINRTVDSAATDLKRVTSEQLALKKSEIAKGIKKIKASTMTLTGRIATTAYRPGLIEFPHKRLTRGISYRISRKEGRKRLRHGFYATMETGHRGVFLRKGLSRLPIAEAHGPSIWQVVTDTPGLLAGAQQRAGEKLSKHINDQVGVELRRWNKR